MSAQEIPALTLNDGVEMPQIGFGTYKLLGDDATRMVRAAIDAGYRHIDTASFYDNEEEVGRAIREAIKAGDVTREELFITTKVWNDDQGARGVRDAFRRSMKRLNLSYLDLYLVHWPWPQRGLYNETFEAMAEIQGLGDIQSIGVCNFYDEVLDDLIETTGITPVLNQVELHIGFTQPELQEQHARQGVVTEAWAPLGRGKPLDRPEVQAVAEAHGVTTAEVALAYLMNKDISVIPKTASEERMTQNLKAASLKLSAEELAALDALEGAEGISRLSGDPRTFPGEVDKA